MSDERDSAICFEAPYSLPAAHPMMLNAAAARLSLISSATASSTALHSTANMLQLCASADAISCWDSASRAREAGMDGSACESEGRTQCWHV